MACQEAVRYVPHSTTALGYHSPTSYVTNTAHSTASSHTASLLLFQFARIEDDNGREVILAWTATAMDTGLKVFVKTYKTKYLPEAQREWHITSRHLQPPHPNVTGMLDYEEHGQVGFGIFRYHNCKDLFDHIADLYTREGVRRGKTAYSEREVQSMIQQICIPLQWMHRKGVAHRDLKPENMMGGHVSRVRAITEKERKSSVDDRLLCIVDLGACGHCHTVEVEDQGSQKAHNQNLRLTDSAQLSAVAHGSFVPISEGFASPAADIVRPVGDLAKCFINFLHASSAVHAHVRYCCAVPRIIIAIMPPTAYTSLAKGSEGCHSSSSSSILSASTSCSGLANPSEIGTNEPCATAESCALSVRRKF